MSVTLFAGRIRDFWAGEQLPANEEGGEDAAFAFGIRLQVSCPLLCTASETDSPNDERGESGDQQQKLQTLS